MLNNFLYVSVPWDAWDDDVSCKWPHLWKKKFTLWLWYLALISTTASTALIKNINLTWPLGFMKIKESLLVHNTPDNVLLWFPVQVFDFCVIFDDLTRTILEEVERPTVLLPGEAC